MPVFLQVIYCTEHELGGQVEVKIQTMLCLPANILVLGCEGLEEGDLLSNMHRGLCRPAAPNGGENGLEK